MTDRAKTPTVKEHYHQDIVRLRLYRRAQGPGRLCSWKTALLTDDVRRTLLAAIERGHKPRRSLQRLRARALRTRVAFLKRYAMAGPAWTPGKLRQGLRRRVTAAMTPVRNGRHSRKRAVRRDEIREARRMQRFEDMMRLMRKAAEHAAQVMTDTLERDPEGSALLIAQLDARRKRASSGSSATSDPHPEAKP